MPYEAGVLARIRSCNPVNAGLTASLARCPTNVICNRKEPYLREHARREG